MTVQIYKKVLLLLLIICLSGINQGCHKKVLPTTYPNKPGIFPLTWPFKEYRLKREPNNGDAHLSKAEKKLNKKSEREKRKALKEQKRGRKEHIKRQTPEVQKRMKESFKESERLRKRKTFWDKLKFWEKHKKKSKLEKPEK